MMRPRADRKQSSKRACEGWIEASRFHVGLAVPVQHPVASMQHSLRRVGATGRAVGGEAGAGEGEGKGKRRSSRRRPLPWKILAQRCCAAVQANWRSGVCKLVVLFGMLQLGVLT